MILNKQKIAVGLSGGVDSATAVHILKSQGYEVIGITMYLFDIEDEFGNFIPPPHIEDARRVAESCKIPFYVADFRKDFEENVIDVFSQYYRSGLTPNPCVFCNKSIKYGKLLEFAHSLGAYYLATGHYANIAFNEITNRYSIYRGKNPNKDQSYVIHGLKQNQLKYIKLPLYEYDSKDEIRTLASKYVNTDVSKKKDSMGICFVPNGSYSSYIKQLTRTDDSVGNFVDKDGNVLGTHLGITSYTIGQKRRLGMDFKPPLSVIRINTDASEILLGDDSELYDDYLIAKNPNFTHFDTLVDTFDVIVKICQWGYFLEATVAPADSNTIKITFKEPVRAIAPGQNVVLYMDDKVIGGAEIVSSHKF